MGLFRNFYRQATMPYAKLAALVLSMALGAGGLYGVYARPAIAHLEATIAEMKAADAKSTADFQSAARQKEQEALDAQAKIESKYMAAQKQRDSIIAGLSRTGSSLRDQLAAYAHCDRGGLPEATAAAGQPDDRAAVLGGLLAEGVGLLVEGAGYGSRDADQLRALQSIETPK
jgi:hypothetical protein